MEAERRQMWANYFAHLANRMGLRDWRIIIRTEPTPEDDDAAAQIQCVFGKKVAQIRLNANWDDYMPSRQREFAVHELVHAHFHPADTLVVNSLKNYMSRREADSLYEQFDHLTEFGIDGIAKVLAPHLALPGEVVPALRPAEDTEFSEEIGEGFTEAHYEHG